jgi:hypothetical protein
VARAAAIADLHLGVGESEIPLGQRLAFREVLLLEVGQQRDDRSHRFCSVLVKIFAKSAREKAQTLEWTIAQDGLDLE